MEQPVLQRERAEEKQDGQQFPLLRLKRLHGVLSPDTVHVRVLKRQRLVDSLNNLSLQAPKRVAEADEAEGGADDSEKYVVYKRVRGGGDGESEADAGDVRAEKRKRKRVMDVDASQLAIVGGSSRKNPGTIKTAEGEDGNYIMFSANCITTAAQMTEQGDSSVEGSGAKEVRAFLDAERVDELRELLHEAFDKARESDSDEEAYVDDPDFDARTVDYPSTPERESDDDVAYGYGDYGDEDSEVDEDANEGDDFCDYERYERQNHEAEYDDAL